MMLGLSGSIGINSPEGSDAFRCHNAKPDALHKTKAHVTVCQRYVILS